ncbi:MAG: hypothetical protein ACKOW5_00325 [Actinomycetales bacterium]
MSAADERLGVTSRISPARGRKSSWRIRGTLSFPLPVVVDYQYVDPQTKQLEYRIEATVGLIDGSPGLLRMLVEAPGGMDLVRLQREFRWASPLDIVTRSIPIMLERGLNPFEVDLPTAGFPEAAELKGPVNAQLSDAFLEEIAREYLIHGRGYARQIAANRQVSPRTVVSWVEKARRRGILTRVPAGGFGGQIVPTNKRRSG